MDFPREKISSHFKKGRTFLGFLSEKISSFFKYFFSKFEKDKTIRHSESDKRLVLSLSRSKIPSLKQLTYLNKFLNPKERTLLFSGIGLIIVGSIFLTTRFYFRHLEIRPVAGGQYIEGLVGTPKLVNPLYGKVSDTDNDLMALVYSSLFKRDNNRNIVPDLVESYTVSDDGKMYDLKIKNNVKWHDGKSLTAGDIVFTFNAIENKDYQSTLRPSLTGIRMDFVDDYDIKVTLPQPYASLPELLTFGIIPQHLWENIPPASVLLSEYNLKPVGTGPYRFKSLIADKTSGRIQAYNLTVNKNYYNGSGYIEDLIFKFFPSSEEAISALNENTIDGLGYLPRDLKGNIASQGSLNIHNLNIPQINLIFFNQEKNPALADKTVRQALDFAVNKEKIVAEIFDGDARVVNGPILPENFAYDSGLKPREFDLDGAKKMLEDDGWVEEEITQATIDGLKGKKSSDLTTDEAIQLALGVGKWRYKLTTSGSKRKKTTTKTWLRIQLLTPDKTDSIKVADLVSSAWEKLGAKITVESLPLRDLQTGAVKDKNYQALLFGQILGADPDIYPFWHSTQSGDSGLNIANYKNKEIDSLLEDARVTTKADVRIADYKRVQEIIYDEVPAIFLYSPGYLYVQNKNIKNFNTQNILLPSDRFTDVTNWYVKTGKKIKW